MIEQFDNEESCPFVDSIMSMLRSRPLGMSWPYHKMLEFLEKRGYLILHWSNKTLVCKGDEDCLPEETNVKEVFEEEIQDIILNKLAEL